MTVLDLVRPLSLVTRELSRNPRRTSLTFIGLVLSFFLYTSLESVLYTLDHMMVQTASETSLFMRPRDRVSFFLSALPRGYTARVRQMNGVVAASPVRLHIGQGRAEDSFVAALGVEVDAFLQVDDIEGTSPEAISALRASRTSALLGQRVLETNGWKVGEEVTIRGRGRIPPISVRVVGSIESEGRLGGLALLHLDYLEDVLGGKGRVTFIRARVDDASRAPALAQAIDRAFANFTVPTETTTDKAHINTLLGSLADALGALRAIGYLTLGITVLVVGNSVAMSVRERTREIGTLRALGYGRNQVMGLVLGEAMLVAIVGGSLGALVAYGVFAAGWVGVPIGRGFEFITDWRLVLQAAALSIPVGALAALQPAWSAIRMPITDALRYAD